MLIHTLRAIALLALLIGAGQAALAAPVLVPGSLTDPSADLDGNGSNEIEYSRIYQSFLAPTNATGGQTVQFSFMLMTSEASTAGQHASATEGFDVFMIRLRKGSTVISSLRGVIYNDGETYSGSFTQYDFVNDDRGGTPLASPVNQPFTFNKGGTGMSITHHVADGGTGWLNGALSFANGDGAVTFEAVIADGGDNKVDSILLLDNVRVVTSGSNGTGFSNGSFETTTFGSWTRQGETGIYGAISSVGGLATINPTLGTYFAALGTGNVDYTGSGDIEQPAIPEPTSLAAMGAGLALVLRRSRRAA